MENSPSFSVLVIDDEPSLRNAMALKLSSRGYEVFQAADGREGLELALKSLPDVIVSDLMMPNMNGAELIDALKAVDSTRHIPVIVLSNVDNVIEYQSISTTSANLDGIKIVKKAETPLDRLVDLVNQAIAMFVC
ncbi:MAG: response regulator [Acidimicrobiia bacterium]|nr:response regulator [Acidimicrobiia bacterium]